MPQTLEELREHYLRTMPGISAMQAHILAWRALEDAYLDAPTDIRLLPMPTATPGGPAPVSHGR